MEWRKRGKGRDGDWWRIVDGCRFSIVGELWGYDWLLYLEKIIGCLIDGFLEGFTYLSINIDTIIMYN